MYGVKANTQTTLVEASEITGQHNYIPYHVLLHAYDRMEIEDSYGQHI